MHDPNLRILVFATNCTLAALAAVWIACSWKLPHPGWAVLTVFVSSQPLARASAAVAARAFYRFAGTLAGGAASLVLMPLLADTPQLLIVGMALWIAACSGLALIDRTVRSHAFLLAGYTVALVALPFAGTPTNLFGNVLLRVEEVGVGALCAALTHSLFFPRHVKGLAMEKLQGMDPHSVRARIAQGLGTVHQLLDNMRVPHGLRDYVAGRARRARSGVSP
jgi:uncharacterized membrane protein YccC